MICSLSMRGCKIFWVNRHPPNSVNSNMDALKPGCLSSYNKRYSLIISGEFRAEVRK